MRTHVVLPEDLVAEVDRFAGKRKRSAFVEEAIRAKLARERLGRALRETAGVLDPADYPEWATPELTSAWVHSMRQRDAERLTREIAAREE